VKHSKGWKKSNIGKKVVRWSVILAGLVAAVLMVDPPRAQALSLRLSDGNTTVETSGNGVVYFVGPVGDWVVNVSTGVSYPVLGAPGVPTLDLNSINVTTNGPSNLKISLSQSGYIGPTVTNFLLSVGGVTSGIADFQAYVDGANTLFGTSTLLGSLGPFSGGAFSGTTGGPVGIMSSLYSLTLEANLAYSSGGWQWQGTSFNFEAKLPEPATIILLGSGLVLLGLVARKRQAV
jgi:hypothetical protein